MVPLHVFSRSFLTDRRLRAMLRGAGWSPRLGWPDARGTVGIWGASPASARGRQVAARTGAAVLRIEDAPIRSVLPGRSGEAPLGLTLDRSGVHFDPSGPSDLETLLATHPLDDAALLSRARDGMERLAAMGASKYSAHDPAVPPPEPGYALVLDQTRGDAAVTASRGTQAVFAEMLFAAREDHPGARILIRAHPETAEGHRPGHYAPGAGELADPAVGLRALLEGAVGVYTLSSQGGFDAILAGHRPAVFGAPFYAGWGLTDDRAPEGLVPRARRGRTLTRAQIFAGAMLLHPFWWDGFRGREGTFETALDELEARLRAWREDRHGHVAVGMRLWKRRSIQRMFGRWRRVAFEDRPVPAVEKAKAEGRDLLVWGTAELPGVPALRRAEDGFLRSRGLGADLVPPLSLVTDGRGLYYDPSRPSDLEAAVRPLRDWEARRAERLIASLRAAGVGKYNLGGTVPPLPDGPRVLVPGQVEDDASIRLGAGEVRTNRALLEAARAARPGAAILYKPHPDVERGLRPGALPDAHALADMVLEGVDAAALLDAVDEVWTMTSTLGFEALLRGVPVTCLGVPFYAGWGLTTDLEGAPARRGAATLEALVHAALIDYPRYHDPATNAPCPVEVAIERLASGAVPRRGPGLRALAKAQGLLAGRTHLWR
ncbi:capsular polysaccharide export protein [Hasllibacter halocynthiae]|uniref:Capsular polysaccharide export protein n=1 Tax=Hasllibacter halocynthiae TaxID=595589 RepID=A0A2T0X718_9RHOB|nr:capsular polysaccharide biosynthesis protein [Hasllibacter halocynthiae]PRY94729.1 capsular polysaccharide export protein [Hasllibacter halocynthiae]